MIKEKIIGMLVSIFILLLACSERDENDSLINSSIMGEDKVEVNLSLSLPGMQIDGNTDYRPMSTRQTEENVLTIVSNSYKCVVLKEIGTTWYVDSIVDRQLTSAGKWAILNVTKDTQWNDLKLTLRPGRYHVLAVLNPGAVDWNKDLVPGMVVKNGTDTVPHAYKYYYEFGGYPNYGKRYVGREIFAGTADFVVKKTPDLHSEPVNGNTHITFVRKVMRMRFLLKDEASPINNFNFKDTQYYLSYKLKTGSDTPFCDGLDCWGNPYYNQQAPTTVLDLYTCLRDDWQESKIGTRYKMALARATVYSPFVFTDSLAPQLPYMVDEIIIAGQSGDPLYPYPNPIPDLTLTNSTIQQFVFRLTDKVTEDSKYQQYIALEYLKEESSRDLFDDNFECNRP